MSDLQEKYLLANKFHYDHGAMFKPEPSKDAIKLIIQTRGPIPNETIWIPKSVCRWDINTKTADVHLYIQEWWYNRNEEKFEV